MEEKEQREWEEALQTNITVGGAGFDKIYITLALLVLNLLGRAVGELQEPKEETRFIRAPSEASIQATFPPRHVFMLHNGGYAETLSLSPRQHLHHLTSKLNRHFDFYLPWLCLFQVFHVGNTCLA